MSSSKTVLQWTRRSFGVGLAGSLGYGSYIYKTDPGAHRMAEAYGSLIPVVLHYRLIEALHKWGPTTTTSNQKQDWQRLDDLYAIPTVRTLGRLQGMYCKYGQTAAGFTNTFGDAWIQEFRSLESDVPPRSVQVVYETIRQETGKAVEDTFSFFDPDPLGSASIGQVHRAVLKETGQTVAVKVQYPEAQNLFQTDMHAIRAFCQALAPEHVIVLNALERQNREELDYRNEASNLQEVRRNMIKGNFQPGEVIVPAPLIQYTTKRMLVMEWVEGPKLMDGMRSFFSKWAEQNGTTLQTLEQEARDRIEREGIPARYDGPSASRIAWYRRSLQAYDGIVNAGVFVYNQTIGRLRLNHNDDARSLQLSYQHSTLPPNTPRIVDVLMRVHGHQLLKNGVFNSDPHGGNFILLKDGRLGLIDYGATKVLTRNERLSACVLYAALGRQDEKRLHDMCKLGGYKSKYGKKDVLMKLLVFGYDSWGHDVTGGKNVQQFLDELKEEDPWEEVPDNLVLAQFMSIRLRSLALGMNHPVRCSDWWGPMAEEILREEGLPYESWNYDQMEVYKPELNMQSYKFA